MKFALTLAAALIAAPLTFAQTSLPSEEPGRFQIGGTDCLDEKKCVAFGIDTKTGAVFACQYEYTPGLYDFGGQCKMLPMRDRVRGSASQ